MSKCSRAAKPYGCQIPFESIATNTPLTDTSPAFSRSPSVIFDYEIVQQPVRARMCGLGDKDRRQISPPVFLKVHAFDAVTKERLDVNDVDISNIIIIVSLWSADEKVDLSLSQTIINGSSPESSLMGSPDQMRAIVNDTTSTLTTNSSTSVNYADDEKTNAGKNNNQSGEVAETAFVAKAENEKSYLEYEEEKPKRGSTSDSDESLGDVPTRNLIGSTVTNAVKLYDEQHQRGVWFVLSDLSIRIEGEFKLKFKLVDLASNTTVEKFSNAFKVYSAKKFPGVVDSIPLGRVFASQGVKIAIRRETKD
ncbi:CYFA0S07e04456g1_1 [Cyberlindnera fabianii]|uniref:CYFA0S07e04456g1_1 n=1 Tax=Cyberlindnera fabianii TaxID=36022 RepID=A0A061B1W4_CYBFA|nr:CYFA0S07e04456g1_1 [Cyberlindnera fabianii]